MSTKPKKSYWIEFIGDRSLKIEEGQSILEASLAAGIPHYHACGGNAQCSTCRVLVERGAEHLTPFNQKESALRARIPMPSNVRLACQTFVTGSPCTCTALSVTKTTSACTWRMKCWGRTKHS